MARNRGDTTMVVSATPSRNTVRFYLHRGFEPTAEPLPELYYLEPEDVHLQKRREERRVTLAEDRRGGFLNLYLGTSRRCCARPQRWPKGSVT